MMAETLTVTQAISQVMAEVIAVHKDSKNVQQGFNFRGIDAVMNAVGPAFRTHGVVTMPHVISYTEEIVPTKNGGTMNRIILKADYEFFGPAGDSVSCTVYGEASDSGDKAMAKAHSVAYRTALLQVLTIPTDEPDPDATSFERGPVPAERPKGLASDKQVSLIFALAQQLGWSDQYLFDSLKRSVGKDHPGDLTGGREGEASKMIDYLTGKVKAAADAEKESDKVVEDLGGEIVDEFSGPDIQF